MNSGSMPLFWNARTFVGFMFVFPAGLALYVCVNTTISIFQMWLVRRKFPMPPSTAAAAAETGAFVGGPAALTAEH